MAKRTAPTPVSVLPKRIVLSATNKGGVGKSFFMVHYAQWLKNHPAAPQFRAFDPDHANKTLIRQHPDVTSFIDVDDELGCDEIVRCLAATDLAIADGLGSQQRKTFGAWIRDVNLIEQAPSLKAALTFILVVEDNREVIEQAAETEQETPAGVDFLVVFNRRGLRAGRPSTLWAGSSTRKRLLDRGALEIELPGCPKAMADLLTHLNVPAHALAANRLETVQLDACAHQRFKNFARDIDVNLDAAAHILLPGSVLAAAEA